MLQDEGIVCKQLESPWRPDDRSGCWVKMKPEYTGQQELDCAIIAVYLGNGSRGGQVSYVCVRVHRGGLLTRPSTSLRVPRTQLQGAQT
jgi:ATP-dependent DNA ligase